MTESNEKKSREEVTRERWVKLREDVRSSGPHFAALYRSQRPTPPWVAQGMERLMVRLFSAGVRL